MHPLLPQRPLGTHRAAPALFDAFQFHEPFESLFLGVHKVLDVKLVDDVAFPFVIDRVADFTFSVKALHLFFQLRRSAVSQDDGFRHDSVKVLVIGDNDLVIEFLVVDQIVYDPFYSVEAASGNVEITSAESCIDFKITVFAVSFVLFDIVVCKACVPGLFQESDGLVHDLAIHLVDDGHWISDSCVPVIFQDRVSERHEAHF